MHTKQTFIFLFFLLIFKLNTKIHLIHAHIISIFVSYLSRLYRWWRWWWWCCVVDVRAVLIFILVDWGYIFIIVVAFIFWLFGEFLCELTTQFRSKNGIFSAVVASGLWADNRYLKCRNVRAFIADVMSILLSASMTLLSYTWFSYVSISFRLTFLFLLRIVSRFFFYFRWDTMGALTISLNPSNDMIKTRMSWHAVIHKIIYNYPYFTRSIKFIIEQPENKLSFH